MKVKKRRHSVRGRAQLGGKVVSSHERTKALTNTTAEVAVLLAN
jgi:hypothetical protein